MRLMEDHNESRGYQTISELKSTLDYNSVFSFDLVAWIPIVIVLLGYLCTFLPEVMMHKRQRSTVSLPSHQTIPHHIAVIMDGNRRFGRKTYGTATKGHSDGSQTLVHFVDWCREIGIRALTVFAFSTENWRRDPSEVSYLMAIFEKFMHRIANEAITKNIRIRVLSSDATHLPVHIQQSIADIEAKTKACSGFVLSICVSYGARNEMLNCCKQIATDVAQGSLRLEDITEQSFEEKLLTYGVPDPDIVIRTSGERRLSNFLLYQLAYAELIFVEKLWPEFSKTDLVQVVAEFNARKRRYGK